MSSGGWDLRATRSRCCPNDLRGPQNSSSLCNTDVGAKCACENIQGYGDVPEDPGPLDPGPAVVGPLEPGTIPAGLFAYGFDPAAPVMEGGANILNAKYPRISTTTTTTAAMTGVLTPCFNLTPPSLVESFMWLLRQSPQFDIPQSLHSEKTILLAMCRKLTVNSRFLPYGTLHICDRFCYRGIECELFDRDVGIRRGVMWLLLNKRDESNIFNLRGVRFQAGFAGQFQWIGDVTPS